MPNNHAFTDGFVSGLRGQRDPIKVLQRKRMFAAIHHRARMANALPHIRMEVSPWVLDANGCPTRWIYQLERARDVPG